VSYFGRIAGRASGAGMGPAVAPALRSDSPLAQYDQRFNLTTAVAVPDLAITEGVAGAIPGEPGAAAGQETSGLAPAPQTSPAPAMRDVDGGATFAGRPSGELAPALPFPTPVLEPSSDPAWSAARSVLTAPPVGMHERPGLARAGAPATGSPAPRTVVTSTAVTLPGTPPIAPRAGQTAGTEGSEVSRSVGGRTHVATASRAPAGPSSERVIADALAKVEAWMRSPAQPRQASDTVPLAAPVAPRVGASLPGAPPVALRREAPAAAVPAPGGLHIGRIDIEVVPPPERTRPAPREHRPLPRPTLGRPLASSTIPGRLLFGLRQR
jgi:hypothetical protein